MSAVLVGVLAPEPAGMPSHSARPALRLVASGGVLRCDDRLLDAQAPAIRFTRRGRLVVTLMTAVAVLALAMMLASSVDAAAPEIDHAATVKAGQTLSEVAAVQLPGLPVRDAVARIQLVNGMNSLQVQAGQSLLIPAVP